MSFPFNITNPGFVLGGQLTSGEADFVTNLAGLSYAQGDILYHDGTNLNRLAAGTNGQILSTQGAGANPQWVTASGTGDMLAATYDPNTVAGDAFLMTNMNGTNWRLFYSNGTGDVTELAFGTSGQVLQSNGASAAPSWVAQSGGSSAINDLSDVTITSVANDEVLQFTGTVWENQTLAEAGIAAASHTHTASEITDFDTEVSNNASVAANTAKVGVTTEISNVVEDTTPQLGGALDVQANAINTSTVNGNITLTPNGTGNVVLGSYTFDGDQTVGAGQDNFVLTYDNGTGVISLEAAAGGGLTDVVDDTTPQLGGSLDVNGNSIVSVTNGDIPILPNGTGSILIADGSATNPSIAFNSDQDMGMHYFSAGIMRIVCGGAAEATFATGASGGITAGSLTTGHPSMRSDTGSVSSPNFTFHSDDDTGMYRTGADGLGFAGGGDETLLLVTAGATAVNEITISNAVTGSGPEIQATGGDTNIDLELVPKGTGLVKMTGGDGFDANSHSFGDTTEVDNGNSGTADTIDWSSGNFQKSTMTGNCTYTFTAPPVKGRFQLMLVQDGTGSRTATWPAAVKWPGGTAPTLSTAASSIDIITFYYDGTSYYGVETLDFS